MWCSVEALHDAGLQLEREAPMFGVFAGAKFAALAVFVSVLAVVLVAEQVAPLAVALAILSENAQCSSARLGLGSN